MGAVGHAPPAGARHCHALPPAALPGVPAANAGAARPWPPTCAGLNRLAHFLALETFDHVGTVLRSTIYFVMYYSFASPRCARCPAATRVGAARTPQGLPTGWSRTCCSSRALL